MPIKRSTFRLFSFMGVASALFLLLAACNHLSLSPPSRSADPSPLSSTQPLLFRIVPSTSSSQSPITIPKLRSQLLTPPLVFPPGSRILGFYLLKGFYVGDISVEYLVASRLSWQKTYAFYRHYYAKSNVRWYCAQSFQSIPSYAFALYPNNGTRKNALTFIIYAHADPNDSVESELLAPDVSRYPIIWVGGEVSSKEIEESPLLIPVHNP